MRKFLQISILGLLTVPFLTFGQSNECATATSLPVTANCSSPTSGTTTGATQSFAGCAGTADDDVWYQFTATSANHQITVTPSASMDPVLEIFSGTCASLTSLMCRDFGFAGDAETVNLTGLTIGSVYRVRVFHYDAGSGSGTFSICCTVGAPAPSNNNCSGATSIGVNTACINTAGTTLGASESQVGCVGSADDDVWYSFVATNAQQTVTVTPTTSTFDGVFQVFSGTCASLTTELCVDATFTNDPETSQVVGLVAGQTYFVRVYDYYTANNGNFNICVTGPATAVPTNDEPCNAIQLPTVTSNCNYLEFTTIGATTTLTPGAPSACAGGGGAMIGGYTTASGGTKDIWFAITVPANGSLYITPKPNMPAGRISDGVMVLYSGTCGSLTQLACSDDNNFPGTINDAMPFISRTGLVPGSTVYLRFFGFGTSSGTFGLCVTTLTNDVCANALYICDLNGYSASTSAAYTPDRPCNMHGNNETNVGVDQPNGTNTGGIFGQAGPWGTGSPAFDVNINNNSWIRFTASAASAVLSVSVIDCWVGNYPSGGIQMQIFSSTGGCCNFTPVSNFMENSTGFTITANGLTVGNDYYLMIDGFAGDICNYTISAQSGVQFPAITPVGPICTGQTVNLTAPNGGTSYSWAHNGATSQTVTVTPPTTQTYSVEVSGICGAKQTLTTTVVVNPIPSPPTVTSAFNLCNGQTLNLTASTVSGGTYSWTGPGGFTSNVQNPSISNVNATHAGSYTVTVTVNGCTSSSSSASTVSVNPIPSTPTAGSNSPVCTGQPINLTSSTVPGTVTYSWSGPSSFTSSLQNPTRPSAIAGHAGTYIVTATVNGCTSAGGSTVVVINPTPTAPVASSNSPVCSGNSINLSASTVGSSTYVWTGPNSFSSTNQNPSIGSAGAINAGVYSVQAVLSGCSSTAATTTVVVNPTPATPSVTSNSPICSGSTLNLSTTATGVTYSWTGPNSFTSTIQNPSITSATSINAGTYNLIVTASSCSSASGSTAVVINTPATVNPGSNLASCNGSAVSLNGSVGGSATSGTWTSSGTGSFGNPAVLNTTYTPSPADVTAGSVILTLTTNDPTGPCGQVSGTITVTVSSSPNAAFSYPATPYCQNNADPSPVFPAGSSGGVFSSTAGLSLNSTSGVITLATSTPGSYTVTNFIAANGSCPSATANSSVTVVGTPPTPSATNNGLICENGSINLSTSASGGTYSWTGPNGFTSSLQNPVIANATNTEAGTYQVTITVAGCTSSTGTTTVAITPNPIITIANGATAAICSGDVLILTANGGTTYSWSTTETTSTISVNPTSPTTYIVTGTTSGCSSTDQIDVAINTPATLSTAPVSNPSDCNGSTGSLVGIVVSGSPTIQYQWMDASSNNVGTSADLTNVPAGSYTVLVTDGNLCTVTFGPFVVNNFAAPAPPTITVSSNQPCEAGSFTATASTITNATYSWNGPNAFTSSLISFTLDPLLLSNTGNYCVIATVNGCPSSPACELITVNPIPTIDINAANNDTVACINETIDLTASGGTSYAWTGPNGFTSPNAQISIIAANVNQSGYYFVTGTNGQNCSNTDSIQVTVNPLPIIVLTSDVGTSGLYCVGSIATLSASGGTNYSWTGPNGFTSSLTTIQFNPVTTSNSGTYLVTITDANLCAATDSIPLNVENPNFGGISGDTTLCPGARLELTATGGVSYQWTGPNGFTSSQAIISIPNIQASQTGVYSVIITNINGCTSTDSVTVSTQISPECLIIPELVTPDKDGHNDTWDINGLSNYPNATVDIFNRWGNIIYAVSPYSKPWAGETNKGVVLEGGDSKVPLGTYFYIIRLNDVDKNEYKGYIELQY